MIIIHNATDRVEMEIQIENSDLPSNGDASISVNILSNGFQGHNEAGVFGEELDKFRLALYSLNQKRQGEATLNSIAPEEFYLKIFSIDLVGHMGVKGKIGNTSFGGNSLGFKHSLEFGFEFDPSQIEELLKVLPLYSL